MFALDLKKVADFARRAETEQLLDRVTVYRDQMEPEALVVIEAELTRRGVTEEAVLAHGRKQFAASLVAADGLAVRCSSCDRPAVEVGRGWHKVWGILPVWPRVEARCEVHKQPAPAERESDPAE